MTTKHTPGPWLANWHGNDLTMPCAIVTQTGVRIAKMNPTLSIDDPYTAEANANLIAAAPDLLGFLADYLWSEHSECPPDRLAVCLRPEELRDKARELFAQVEGGEG